MALATASAPALAPVTAPSTSVAISAPRAARWHWALALLAGQARKEGCDYVFPSESGKALSDMTLTAVMRRMELTAVPHGFRSTFRDWAAECTDYDKDVVEMALAHTIESKVEAAYRRGDLLEKRTQLMQDWANHCIQAQ